MSLPSVGGVTTWNQSEDSAPGGGSCLGQGPEGGCGSLAPCKRRVPLSLEDREKPGGLES